MISSVRYFMGIVLFVKGLAGLGLTTQDPEEGYILGTSCLNSYSRDIETTSDRARLV